MICSLMKGELRLMNPKNNVEIHNVHVQNVLNYISCLALNSKILNKINHFRCFQILLLTFETAESTIKLILCSLNFYLC